MKAWRLAALLLTMATGALAAEPAGGPDAELSLELLEFLGEYGTTDGELALPEDFDAALAEPDESQPAPSTTPETPAKQERATIAVEIKQ